jgi:hypothetical protein
VEEHDHPMIYRLGEEGINIADIHMVGVEGMDMMELPSNHWMEVGDIYREDSDMVKVEMVEREHEDVMLVR